MKRVAQGPVEARSKIVSGMATAFAEAGGLFEPFEREHEALDEGWLPVPSPVLRTRFLGWATSALDALGLPGGTEQEETTTSEFVASSSGDLIAGEGTTTHEPAVTAEGGGRRGRHTDDLRALWRAMTTQYRENEGATW
jgi:hypothetical protein